MGAGNERRVTSSRGRDVLRHPALNKGTGFPPESLLRNRIAMISELGVKLPSRFSRPNIAAPRKCGGPESARTVFHVIDGRICNRLRRSDARWV